MLRHALLAAILPTAALAQVEGETLPLDGRPVRGELSWQDQAPLPGDHPRAAREFARAAHVVSAEVGTVVEITVQADFDTRLILLDPRGQIVAEADDQGSLHVSRASHCIEAAGPHCAVVTTFSPGTHGTYLIAGRVVSERRPVIESFPPLVDEALWAALREGDALAGRRIEGSLSPGSRAELPPRAPDLGEGISFQVYPTEVTGECVQSFDLRADFDCVLTLLAPTGQMLRRSDDHRTIDHSRIDEVRFRAPGRYLLVVSGHASGEHGDYTLTVGNARRRGGGGDH